MSLCIVCNEVPGHTIQGWLWIIDNQRCVITDGDGVDIEDHPLHNTLRVCNACEPELQHGKVLNCLGQRDDKEDGHEC